MALVLKIDISNSVNCQTLIVQDTTGDYDVNSNPGGWGAPNPALSDLVAATLTITKPYENVALTPIDVFAAPYEFPQTNDYVLITNPVLGGSVIGTITDASNTSPIVITTAAAHNLSTNAEVTIFGVLGNLAANGNFTITVLSTTTFSLNGTVGTGAYSSGGTVIAGGSSTGSLTDGVWKFVLEVEDSLGETYLTEEYYFMTCQTRCCISKYSYSINENDTKDNTQYDRFRRYTTDLQMAQYAFDCNQYEEAEAILQSLRKKLNCTGC